MAKYRKIYATIKSHISGPKSVRPVSEPEKKLVLQVARKLTKAQKQTMASMARHIFWKLDPELGIGENRVLIALKLLAENEKIKLPDKSTKGGPRRKKG